MTLTRRQLDTDGQAKSWGIYDGEVRVGSISERSGVPLWADPWQWSCGFYPGCDLRTQVVSGTAATFEAARADFQAAWEQLEPQITPAMRTKWLEQQAFTAWKYAMWDASCKMPTQSSTGRSVCFCGAEITIASTKAHICTAHTP